MNRFERLNPEDKHREHMAMQDDYEAHDARLDRRYRFDPSYSPRIELTPSERALLHGFRLIDNALNEEEAA